MLTSRSSRSRVASRARSRFSTSSATTLRTRSARSRSRRTSCSRPSCRRRVAGRSCGGCCGTSRTTGRSETRRRSPTRPWSRRFATGRSPKVPRDERGAPARRRPLQPGLGADGVPRGRRPAAACGTCVAVPLGRGRGVSACEPRARRVADLARLHGSRASGAGDLARAPVPRPLRGQRDRRLGSRVRVRGAGARARACGGRRGRAVEVEGARGGRRDRRPRGPRALRRGLLDSPLTGGSKLGDMELTEELSIGAFSRVSGLTVKALRHYDEIGLLEPARVDEWTGYRYYGLEQARTAEAIRRLRSLEVPLDEIRELLGADDPVLRERLAVHRARLEGRAVETKRILDELDRIIDGREKLVPDATQLAPGVEVKDIPTRRVVLVAERVHMEEMKVVVPRNIDRVAHAVRMRHTGPPFCRCPAPDEEGYFETEIGWPVPDDVEVEAPFEVAEYAGGPALVMKHVGPYEELGRSYRVMAEQLEERGLEPASAPVEWYESDPQQVPDPKDYVTTIEWPVATE